MSKTISWKKNYQCIYLIACRKLTGMAKKSAKKSSKSKAKKKSK
jgi:hypothetical protein